MANWSVLKAAVANIINTNGNQEITGQLLQNVLNNIITNVGENAAFAGIATPSTNPGVPDGPVFYLATTADTYPNFNGIKVLDGEASILLWDNGSWTKKTSGFATQEKLSDLDLKVEWLYEPIGVEISLKQGHIDNQGILHSPSNGSYVYSAPIKVTKNTLYRIKSYANFSISVVSETDAESSFYTPVILTGNDDSNKHYYYYFATKNTYIVISGPTGISIESANRTAALTEWLTRIESVINGDFIYTEKEAVNTLTGYYQDNGGLEGGGSFANYSVDAFEVVEGESIYVGFKSKGAICPICFYSDINLTNLVKALDYHAENTIFSYEKSITVPVGAKYVGATQLTTDPATQLHVYSKQHGKVGHAVDYLYKQSCLQKYINDNLNSNMSKNAGDISLLKKQCGFILNNATELKPTTHDGFISYSGTILQPSVSGSYKYTDLVKVNKGDILVASGVATDYSVSAFNIKKGIEDTKFMPLGVKYDNDFVHNGYCLAIVPFDGLVAFSYPAGDKLKLYKVERGSSFISNIQHLSIKMQDIIDLLFQDSIDNKVGPNEIKEGYYINSAGNLQGDGAFPGYCVDVYKVSPGESYKLYGTSGGYISAAVAYTDNTLSKIVKVYGTNNSNTRFDTDLTILVPDTATVLAVTRSTSSSIEAEKQIGLFNYSKNAINVLGSLEKKVNNLESAINSEALKTIVSWGDSLTAGAGGNGTTYSNVLASLLGDKYEVLNAGVGGEDTYTISARQGGEPMCLDSEVIIPSSLTPVTITLTNFLDKAISPLKQGGHTTINPCYIDGIKGSLSQSNGVYSFTRSEVGDERKVNAYTPIITNYMKTRRSPYAMIIWIGTNGQYNNSEDLIKQYKKMIEYSGCNNYVVIGMHFITSSYTVDVRKEQEAAFRKEFGVHFLNWREYLATHAIYDAGLTPTEADLQAMNTGKCPPVFLTDTVHLNATAYTLLAKQIYNVLFNLGAI